MEIIWLDADCLIDCMAERFGEMRLVHPDAFYSAVAAPFTMWSYDGEKNLFVLAAVYAYRVAKAHAFADGNKRCGLTAAGVFLGCNDFLIDLPEDSAPEAMAALTADRLSVVAFAALLESWVVRPR